MFALFNILLILFCILYLTSLRSQLIHNAKTLSVHDLPTTARLGSNDTEWTASTQFFPEKYLSVSSSFANC